MRKDRETEEGRLRRSIYRKRNYDQTRKNNFNKCLYYNKQEDLMILEHNISDRELSKKIGRSVQAIQTRRWRIKNGG